MESEWNHAKQSLANEYTRRGSCDAVNGTRLSCMTGSLIAGVMECPVPPKRARCRCGKPKGLEFLSEGHGAWSGTSEKHFCRKPPHPLP
jgi:hypothetical protein